MSRNILVVEDNEKSRQMLCGLLKEIDSELNILEAGTIDRAYRYVHECTIDLFLLDIIIDPSVKGDTSGMTFADQVRNMPKYRTTPIIFITSLEDPKLYAYSEIHCYQFIEKPFHMEKARKVIEEALGLTVREEKHTVLFRKEGVLYPLKVEDIVYIVCEKPYARFYLVNDVFEMPYLPMKDILYRINSRNFIQCNRGTVVNREYVENIDPVNGMVKLKHYKNQITLGVVWGKKFVEEMERG